MHFMKGLNISKKIFKILNKQFKSKINPSAIYFNENEKLKSDFAINPNYLYFHLQNSKHGLTPDIWTSKSQNREITKYYVKHLFLSTSNFFFLYFVLKNKYTKLEKEKKKVYLGCSLKINDVEMKKGIKIVAVKINSPAEKANLQAGDIITKINHTEVNDIDQFNFGLNCGDSNKQFSILRLGKEFQIEVNLGENELN